MNPALLAMIFGGFGAQGMGLAGGRRIGKRIKNFFQDPGFEGVSDWTQGDLNEEAIRAELAGGSGGATGQAAQQDFANQEAAREDAIKRAQAVQDQVTGGALGKAHTDVQNLPAQAIDQATFDRMAASMFDQSRKAAESQTRQTTDYAAQSGGTPYFDYGNQTTVSAQEDERNAVSMRDLLVNQQLANTQYGLDLNQLKANIGGMYNQQFGTASDAVTTASTPVPLAPLGQIQDQWQLMELGMLNENDAAKANMWNAIGNSLFGAGMSQLQSGAALRASQQSSPWGGGFNPIGAVSGAGIGALAGGPGGWAMGASLGGLAGAGGAPAAGLYASPQYGMMNQWAQPSPSPYPYAERPWSPPINPGY